MVEPDKQRIPVGIWIESPHGAQWTNQGMTRLLGFLIEGVALHGEYIFHVIVTDDIRDEAEEDLATLVAVAGQDYTIHSPRDADAKAQSFTELALFANSAVDVAGWISIFPNQTAASMLNAPVSSIFPDAIGLAYHDFSDAAWSKRGPPVIWRERVIEHLVTSNHIITFSAHVATDQVQRLFGVAEDRIRVIPHAPPSLDGILPFVRDGARTPESRFRAASLLRRFAAQRGWNYLIDFPFEHVRYVAVSTQDRVTKNIRIVADAIDRLVRRDHADFKLLMTAQMHFGTHWTPLPNMVEQRQLQFDVLSLPDLPREEHAAFYHCAEMAIHPSVFEGGRGVFPYYESISVGTPCLMADGPHVQEFMSDAPQLAPFVFDPNDADALTQMIMATAADRDAVTRLQLEVYSRLSRRDWGLVATEYARAATVDVQPLGGQSAIDRLLPGKTRTTR